MNEEWDKAAFYEEHKDDPEVWGEPEEGVVAPRRGQLSVTITVRFSPEEASEIRELAKKLGASYSDIVRRAVREFINPPRPLTKYKWARPANGEDMTDFSLTNAATSTGSLV